MMPTGSKVVFQGEIFSVWQWQQRLYDGSIATFEAVKRPDTSHTVGVLPDGKILLVTDTQPHREAVITPAGGVVNSGESAAAAAQREFREETGYEIGKLIPWHTYNPSVKVDWTVHAFIGRRLIYRGKPALEAGEKIELLRISFEEFLELGHSEMLRDKVIRIILLEAMLDTDKKQALKEQLYGE